MNLRDYQHEVSKDVEPVNAVIDDTRRLAGILRYVARRASKLGYTLEELASLDMEKR